MKYEIKTKVATYKFIKEDLFNNYHLKYMMERMAEAAVEIHEQAPN